MPLSSRRRVHPNIASRVILSLLLGLLALQWVPHAEPDPTVLPEVDLGFGASFQQAMRQSCFDCHAQSRALPWYSRVAPFSWWTAREVLNARESLNFSRWDELSERQKDLAWQRVRDIVAHEIMPPPAYRLAHPNLPLAERERLDQYLAALPKYRELTPEELLAWPARAWSEGPVTGVERAEPGARSAPLELQGGVMMVSGDLHLTRGLTGQGAVWVTGELVVDLQTPSLGPVALVGLGGVTLRAASPSRVSGLVESRGPIALLNVELVPSPVEFLSIEGVREWTADFCRDDGMLGEVGERRVVVRHQDDEYVLWDPEFQAVRRAHSPDEALSELDGLMALDPQTRRDLWHAHFHSPWRKALEHLASSGRTARIPVQAISSPRLH